MGQRAVPFALEVVPCLTCVVLDVSVPDATPLVVLLWLVCVFVIEVVPLPVVVNDPVVTAPVELPVKVTSSAPYTKNVLLVVAPIVVTQDPVGPILVWFCANGARSEVGGAYQSK